MQINAGGGSENGTIPTATTAQSVGGSEVVEAVAVVTVAVAAVGENDKKNQLMAIYIVCH